MGVKANQILLKEDRNTCTIGLAHGQNIRITLK